MLYSIWCHPLTESGKAPSDSIYTPHIYTRGYLKCLYFLWLHFDNTQIWFPWVIQFYIEWYMSTSFVVFLFPSSFFFAGKHGFCTEINHAVHTKRHNYWHTSTTRQKQESSKTFKHFPCLCCSESECPMETDGDPVFGCSVSWLCSGKRTKEEPLLKQQVGSIALRMLFCTAWVSSLLKISLWDPGRRGFCCLRCRKSDRLV